MNIGFHGAAGMVTGSCHLLTFDNGFQLLLDCGMFQGMGQQTNALNAEFGFNASTVNAVILSHAHIDHSGRLPMLVKEGFKGKIYCTPPTMELALVLLQDAARIQSSAAQDVEGDALFNLEHVKATLDLFELINYNQEKEIAPGIHILFADAGHLVGSASVHINFELEGKQRQLSYSGDVGRYDHPLLCPPAAFRQADYMILECTYGTTLHDPLYRPLEALLALIQETCLKKKGKLVIAAFSVGRMQELLFYFNQLSLERKLPDIPVIVDSPLASEATTTVKRHKACLSERLQKVLEVDDDPFDFPGLHWTQTVEDSKKIELMNEPCIVLASSGMADAGRVRHHIATAADNSRNTIVLTGYCSPASLGGRLQAGDLQINIAGREIDVKAKVETLRHMSAHADYEQLLRFVSCVDSSKVSELFLVHGEEQTREAFAKKLSLKGFNTIYSPVVHQVFDIS